MPSNIHLNGDEARLVYLALVYHLGRPGSEIEVPGQPQHGLRDVAEALGARLSAAAGQGELELTPAQYERLLSAMKGSVTELRGYHMQAGRSSTVSGWTDAAESLFPQLRGEPDDALTIAEAMMNLQRRIRAAIEAAPDST